MAEDPNKPPDKPPEINGVILPGPLGLVAEVLLIIWLFWG